MTDLARLGSAWLGHQGKEGFSHEDGKEEDQRVGKENQEGGEQEGDGCQGQGYGLHQEGERWVVDVPRSPGGGAGSHHRVDSEGHSLDLAGTYSRDWCWACKLWGNLVSGSQIR